MPLRKSDGNMYPWVDFTHSHLGGKCPHGCSYCYVQAMAERFPNMKAKYSGPVRLIEKELSVPYGEGKIIFIEHMNDLFAHGVPEEAIPRILNHCTEWPQNEYVFQTKDPARIWYYQSIFPKRRIIGTTIETNRTYPGILTKAPGPQTRANALRNIHADMPTTPMFVTIEPILDFDLNLFMCMILDIKPAFVNIGADSKGTNLPEPPWQKVQDLISEIARRGIEIRQKRNLERLKR